ncbi:hypothetical protein AK812_SmicGene41487 [Symbiodinium microadriaticum]|uniref:Uncharacterized protein n=1 Tax=Symbiodinium microadriaticum TaxID=2951 RepID=A0A1Q9C5Z1_SYMMI|nr:hypothetical protein AK812_SmicGene41487 [Symbiodinium microadriaticum]CAE6970093.1 unnamed protein product [Symbiodinium sp. KB8]CAE7759408.1 unnamed protein product [Symbiodinium microadriaticum]
MFSLHKHLQTMMFDVSSRGMLNMGCVNDTTDDSAANQYCCVAGSEPTGEMFCEDAAQWYEEDPMDVSNRDGGGVDVSADVTEADILGEPRKDRPATDPEGVQVELIPTLVDLNIPARPTNRRGGDQVAADQLGVDKLITGHSIQYSESGPPSITWPGCGSDAGGPVQTFRDYVSTAWQLPDVASPWLFVDRANLDESNE